VILTFSIRHTAAGLPLKGTLVKASTVNIGMSIDYSSSALWGFLSYLLGVLRAVFEIKLDFEPFDITAQVKGTDLRFQNVFSRWTFHCYIILKTLSLSFSDAHRQVHNDMIASHNCCRFVSCTSMMRISCSTTSKVLYWIEIY